MTTASAAPEAVFDLIVVGGGINGTGIARDAAGRGMRVFLAEQGDLAQATSSASTKLIHGGLRYLEYYDFRLVREALQERERLLRIAPHIAWPLQFVLPHENAVRPAWLVSLGLFLYDHIGGTRSLPASASLHLAGKAPFGAALKPGIARGFLYSDAWVEDARLVVLNALDARERGARIEPRTRVNRAWRENELWHAECEAMRTGRVVRVAGRALVNAAGPWVGKLLHGVLGVHSSKDVRMVKGSHIVTPRLFDGAHAYILQNADKRIVFAIPYEDDFTLIGTTDVPVDEIADKPEISANEIAYLCASVNHYFRRQISAADLVWSFSGVRPLYDDAARNASAATRDYVLDIDQPAGGAPVLSVFGGKITTYRRLAEHALDRLLPCMGEVPDSWRSRWTDTEPLPGGDLPDADFGEFLNDLCRRAPYLGKAQARRMAHAYGTRIWRILAGAPDLGEAFGGGLTGAEIDYLIAEEWAETAEDVLWRRSKLGLHITERGRDRVAAYMSGLMSAQAQEAAVQSD